MIDIYEEFALGNFLSCWNENISFATTIEAIRHRAYRCTDDDCKLCELQDDIGEWEILEGSDNDWLADQIEGMKENLKRVFIPRAKQMESS